MKKNKNIHCLIGDELYLVSITTLENEENVQTGNMAMILDSFEDFHYLQYIAHDYGHEIEFTKEFLLNEIEKLIGNVEADEKDPNKRPYRPDF